MYEQEELFSNNDNFKERIDSLLNEIIHEEYLLPGDLRFESNISLKGINKGKEISKSIFTYESSYPPTKTVNNNYTIKSMLKIEQSEYIDLFIRSIDLESLELPNSAQIIDKKSDGDFQRIRFGFNEEVYPFIKSVTKIRLKKYKSNASFSCCSKFNECSDNKRCMHFNKLYATGCYYRMHLENCKIFYGKNRNI